MAGARLETMRRFLAALEQELECWQAGLAPAG
jgi:hypothetical protein